MKVFYVTVRFPAPTETFAGVASMLKRPYIELWTTAIATKSQNTGVQPRAED